MTINKDTKNKLVDWFKRNGKTLGMFLLGVFIGGGIMFILWPSRVAELKDGTQVIATVAGKSYTADDLYQSLKEEKGLNTLLEEIDKVILRKEYDGIEKEAEASAKEEAEKYYELYEQNYGMSKEEFLTSNEFKEEEDFLKYLVNDFYYNKYYADYLAGLITEDDITKEYKSNYFATRKNVYFFTSQDDKELVEKVRTALKKGTKPSKIESKYKDIVVNTFDEFKYSDSGYYSTDIVKNIKGLKAGSYTKVFKDESFGYVLIYCEEVTEKEKLEDVKSQIIEVLSNKLDQEDEYLYYKAVFELRRKYKLEFQDTELAKAYKTFTSKYETK